MRLVCAVCLYWLHWTSYDLQELRYVHLAIGTNYHPTLNQTPGAALQFRQWHFSKADYTKVGVIAPVLNCQGVAGVMLSILNFILPYRKL